LKEAGPFRAFLAIPSAAEWIASVRELVSGIRSRSPEASWTRPESWHLTLVFLGDVTPSQAQRLSADCAEIAGRTESGDLLAGEAAIFPPRGSARVLGIGFSPGPGLSAIEGLARGASSAARRVGVEISRRPFHAHVTLARLRHCWPDRDVEDFRDAVAAWSFPALPARELVLFESRLDPSGAVHTPRGRWALSPPAGRAAG
jgi:2'-5' RNA ligase